MKRTAATCIAGIKFKTSTGIKTHFQRPKKTREAKPREAEPFTRSVTLLHSRLSHLRQESAAAIQAQTVVMKGVTPGDRSIHEFL
jgi:hypothetical protein